MFFLRVCTATGLPVRKKQFDEWDAEIKQYVQLLHVALWRSLLVSNFKWCSLGSKL